jgi:hypothetical protein
MNAFQQVAAPRISSREKATRLNQRDSAALCFNSRSIFIRQHESDSGLRVVNVECAASGDEFDKARGAVVVANIERKSRNTVCGWNSGNVLSASDMKRFAVLIKSSAAANTFAKLVRQSVRQHDSFTVLELDAMKQRLRRFQILITRIPRSGQDFVNSKIYRAEFTSS